MARREIRFGIIGGGLMGREFAVAAARWPALLELDAAPRIVGVCDTNPAVFEWYSTNFPSVRTVTTDYKELLEDGEIEAIYCAVPHHLHEAIYSDVIRAGKHLMAEKPFGIDQAACDRIIAAIRDHPEVLVRVSSEFPFYPAAQRIAQAVGEGIFGRIIDVRAGFLHSSDLDPRKPINWKRMAAYNGAYGSMGDLGLHAVHLPFRFGWVPKNVRAVLSNIVPERPGPDGELVPSDTWDNAVLFTEAEAGGQTFPMTIQTKRIAPGETNTWYLEVYGTDLSMTFSTKYPKSLRALPYRPGDEQAWKHLDLGYSSVYRTITGPIFEFGFTDAILQMWAAFVDELVHGEGMIGSFRCATPREAALSHRLFTASLQSNATCSVVGV